METFLLEFSYSGLPYAGVVRTIRDGENVLYSIKLESDNQDHNIELLARPPVPFGSGHWMFACTDGEPPPESYDKALLQEIGEAIERHETDDAGKNTES